MLSDSEILDEKTQSLDTALQELEANHADEAPGPVSSTVRDVLKDQQLVTAVECMGTLTDLWNTISQEGVSVYDVQVLRSVQVKMNDISALRQPKVALERFEGLFTPTRTELNQTVSLEAVKFEFVRILKEWFLKLMDFIIDVVKWVKNVKNSEFMVKARTQAMNDELLSAKQHLTNMRNMNALSDRKLKPAYDAIQEAVLADPKLPKNKLTLMAFGPSQLNAEFDSHLRTVLNFGKIFTTVTTDLVQALEGGRYDQANATFVGSIIEDAVNELNDFTVESTDENYFAKELPDLDMYQPKYVLQRKSYYIEPFNQLLKVAINDLRRIKRFDKLTDDADITRVQEAVQDLTKGIKAMERTIQIIAQLNNGYFKVSASYMNYYSRCFETTRKDFTANVMDDLTRTAFDKLTKSWDKLMDSLAVM